MNNAGTTAPMPMDAATLFDANATSNTDASVLDATLTAADANAMADANITTDAASADAGSDSGTTDTLDALRQACVDTINMYRATLSLPALARASASLEACSDDGAEFDHNSGNPHGSSMKDAIPCRTASVAQNTCPDFPYGGFYGTPEETMKGCLEGMWMEGEPPGGTDKCISDYFAGNPACFLAHGHYINMASATSTQVSCGFYDTGSVMWMNQDFP